MDYKGIYAKHVHTKGQNMYIILFKKNILLLHVSVFGLFKKFKLMTVTTLL